MRAAAAVDGVTEVVVVAGRARPQIELALEGIDARLRFATQPQPRGTADAVSTGLEALTGHPAVVVVLAGDSPLITKATLDHLVSEHLGSGAAVSVVTAVLDDPSGYGRIIRDGSGRVTGIVEEADADDAAKRVSEISTGIWAFDRGSLKDASTGVEPHNAQGELYLPDAAMVLVERGGTMMTVRSDDPEQTMGVNDRMQLARAAALIRMRKVEELTKAGVTIVDPDTTYIDDQVTIGADTTIHPLTFLEGETSIGSGCSIGPSTRIIDSSVADGAEVTFAVVRGSQVGPRAAVGPFASLRPGTTLEEGAKVGTFVETKATRIGAGAKVPHLSYMGDADIGAGTNIGAGSITCNYDGETKTKSKTTIGEDVLVGSDTMLVAPVSLGDGAVTGAGAVVTKDLGPDEVAVGAPARVVRQRKPRPRENGD